MLCNKPLTLEQLSDNMDSIPETLDANDEWAVHLTICKNHEHVHASMKLHDIVNPDRPLKRKGFQHKVLHKSNYTKR